jgi:hypothetical protein
MLDGGNWGVAVGVGYQPHNYHCCCQSCQPSPSSSSAAQQEEVFWLNSSSNGSGGATPQFPCVPSDSQGVVLIAENRRLAILFSFFAVLFFYYKLDHLHFIHRYFVTASSQHIE